MYLESQLTISNLMCYYLPSMMSEAIVAKMQGGGGGGGGSSAPLAPLDLTLAERKKGGGGGVRETQSLWLCWMAIGYTMKSACMICSS